MRNWFRLLPFLLTCASLAAADGPFAGTRACAGCHRAQAVPQPLTSMGHALEPVPQCTILRENPKLSIQMGGYQYSIVRDGDRSLYSVTDGKETMTVPLAWAFGLGTAGQTYVYERNGSWYESRVSFYKALKALDLTIGAGGSNPTNVEEAAGRKMDRRGALECFECHSTGSVQGGALHVEALTPGVTCENCHGSAVRHVAAIQAGKPAEAKMPKLSAMSSEDTSQFCGRCHRTWETIAMNGPHSIANVRFQPYRLTNSKCYDSVDKRIACIACHDPHIEVRQASVDYDSRCAACHQIRGKAAIKAATQKACPVATKDCASCHMPKLELPGAHAKFTDHRIRIVHDGEPYPH